MGDDEHSGEENCEEQIRLVSSISAHYHYQHTKDHKSYCSHTCL